MRTLLTIAGTLIVINAGQALAASTGFVPIAPIPGANPQSLDLVQYINAVFNLALGVGALLAVLMIVYGGFEYIFSGVMEGKKDGRARIQQALYGLALLVLVYLILYIINPQIVQLKLFTNS
jgi:hypothetical protein